MNFIKKNYILVTVGAVVTAVLGFIAFTQIHSAQAHSECQTQVDRGLWTIIPKGHYEDTGIPKPAPCTSTRNSDGTTNFNLNCPPDLSKKWVDESYWGYKPYGDSEKKIVYQECLHHWGL